MKAWVVLAAVASMAVVYVMIPVGLAARGYFRRHKFVCCPSSAGGVLMPGTPSLSVAGTDACVERFTLTGCSTC